MNSFSPTERTGTYTRPTRWGTITDSCEAHTVGYFDCVSIAVWRRAITHRALHALHVNQALVAARNPFVCTLVVVHQGAGLPAADVRAESARLMRTGSPKLRSSVTWIDGVGFWCAAARGALTAIQHLAGHAYPLQSAASARAAVLLTAAHAGRDERWAASLEQAVADVREHRVAGAAPFAAALSA